MTASKIVAAAASGVGGAGLDVDEVFSCHLYKGNGSTQTITNGIDLSGEGGLVWIKNRDDAGSNNVLYDTVRPLVSGNISRLITNSTNAVTEGSNELNSFNNNGFTLGGSYTTNSSSYEYASWTFRKAEKFFDIQTWTGNGASDRAISHNLDSVPGMIIVKRTVGGGEDWGVWHTEVHNNTVSVLYLNNSGALSTSTHIFGATNPTSTDFYVGDHPVSNNNGDTYVAYVFAHNNNDGKFGPDGDQDIIKCGSYTGNGASGNAVNLGFEPQWLMVKNASSANQNWTMFDNMRGVATGGIAAELFPNDSAVERNAFNIFNFNTTGFETESTLDETNKNGDTFVYMAIRRGSLFPPDNATKVFAIDQPGQTSPTPPRQTSGFPVDFFFWKGHTGTQTWRLFDRLRGKVMLAPNSNEAETSNTYAGFAQDQSLGIGSSTDSATDEIMYMWKRAPSYFDVVCYSGTGSNRTISHNLGAVPEMMWVKDRGRNQNWAVYHKGNTSEPETDRLRLNETDATVDDNAYWNDTTPTSSVFTVGTDGDVNANGENYIAYLFATVAGISKVGSYTGNGSTQNIDCGFSSGARFVLIKITSGSGAWRLYDTVRGIVAGDDPQLVLNASDAELSSGYDLIDPHSSGFALPASPYTNNSGETYIFYAIA